MFREGSSRGIVIGEPMSRASAVTRKAQIVWTISLLVVVGFLWAIYAPSCLGRSFAYPAVFGAGIMGNMIGRLYQNDDPLPNTGIFSFLVFNWLYGWLFVIYAVPAVGLGWFIGVLVCFNLLPEFGDYRCIICMETSRQ